MKRATYTLLFASCLCPAWGQVSQKHPEYCGIPGGVNPPLPDISAVIGQHGATLNLGRGNAARAVPLTVDSLPALVSEVMQVCPLSDGRLVVFTDYGRTGVFIIDTAKASLLDSFYAFAPVISPDQRWVAFVKAAPLHGVERLSDEVVLYDLRRNAAQNRPKHRGTFEVGRVIYPPGHENFPGSNINVPKDRSHSGAARLYWAPDSRAIIFADWVQNDPGVGEDWVENDPGVALVTLDAAGMPSAFRHSLIPSELCGRSVPWVRAPQWRLDGAEVGPDQAGSRVIDLRIEITAGTAVCGPHNLRLNSRSSFQPAKVEVSVWERPIPGAIKDGQVLARPKKKP